MKQPKPILFLYVIQLNNPINTFDYQFLSKEYFGCAILSCSSREHGSLHSPSMHRAIMRHLIPDGIHRQEGTIERVEKPVSHIEC